MKLPVMKTDPTPTTREVLWGRYVEIRYEYEAAIAEHEPPELTFGRGVSRDSQPGLLLLSETASQDSIASVNHAFDAAESMRPIVIEPEMADNGRWLKPQGYAASAGCLLRLRSAVRDERDPHGLLVLPARAALPAMEKLVNEGATGSESMHSISRHLDDPQYDCFLAIKSGKPVGQIGLQIRGQTGLVVDWFVQPETRGQGIGRTLLGRAMDLAARSQLLDVFAACEGNQEQALSTMQKLGFHAVCEFRQWQRTP